MKGKHTGHKGKGGLAKEETLTRVANLMRRGLSQSRIAEMEGVTQPMVNRWCQEIRSRWVQSQQDDVGALIAEKIAQLEEIAEEAWAAWERSKQDAQKRTNEFVEMPDGDEEGDGRGGKGRKKGGKERQAPSVAGGGLQPLSERRMILLKTVIVSEGRLPASEYLRIVKDCYAEICKLRGLYPAEKRDVTVQTLDWTALLETPDVLPDDSIDRTLEGMMKELPELSEHPPEEEKEQADE